MKTNNISHNNRIHMYSNNVRRSQTTFGVSQSKIDGVNYELCIMH